MDDGIAREIMDMNVSLCIEHHENRKRPLLVATIGRQRIKVAEITDERTLRNACFLLFARTEK